MRMKLLNFVFVGIAIAGLTTLSSCKKGENDPFLSLKSRKARVTGEWKLTEGTRSSTNTSFGITNSTTTTYTGSTVSYNGNAFSYSETLTIDKEGTYEVVIIEDGEAYTERGNWFFAGKIKDLDLKKKEAIMFVAQSYSSGGQTETYDGLYGGDVMMIDQLKNKEIIFKGSFSFNNNNGSTSSSTYDRTFEKQ